ncbi:MAG: 1-deoxy-D-xylulose-5-phosphate reductoisomerase [Thermotogae bacterium]|nr:1-deoxy-D-xylulose-5-phosphate reductoisomerase [Thermotogota bacterium]
MSVKRVAVLGSTGSIGKQTLEVISHLRNYEVVSLSANENLTLLIDQIRRFHPENAYIRDPLDAKILKKFYPRINIFSGEDGLYKLTDIPVNVCVVAISGFAALKPLLNLIKVGIDRIALANKESIVCAGKIITERLRYSSSTLIPVDSEHSAIFQSISANSRSDVSRLILTASGGSVRDIPIGELKAVNVEKVLQHPNWKMGNKITVDSATMVNKAFEVIEARWLFDVEPEKIDVLIHRQSIIHSLVEFIDGSVIGQMSTPDMRLPIQYALTYPNRQPSLVKPLNLASIKQLTFETVDTKRYPLFPLGYEVLKEGGIMPTFLNAANEVAVNAFLHGRISFGDISYIVEKTLSNVENKSNPSVEEIEDAYKSGKEAAEKMIRLHFS